MSSSSYTALGTRFAAFPPLAIDIAEHRKSWFSWHHQNSPKSSVSYITIFSFVREKKALNAKLICSFSLFQSFLPSLHKVTHIHLSPHWVFFPRTLQWKSMKPLSNLYQIFNLSAKVKNKNKTKKAYAGDMFPTTHLFQLQWLSFQISLVMYLSAALKLLYYFT